VLEPTQLLIRDLELSLAGKSVLRVVMELPLPTTNNTVVDSKISRSLGNALSLLGDQPHGLHLELARITLSCSL
jgi:hypothetical protein